MSAEKMKEPQFFYEFLQACKSGNMNRVRYFLLECPAKAEIASNTQQGFLEACKRNHLEIVKFLLTSHELERKAVIGSGSDSGFFIACFNGYLEMVKFMILSPDIGKKPNPNIGLIEACKEGKIEIIKFLLTEPSLKNNKEQSKRINIHYNDNNALKIAVFKNRLEVVDYLLTSRDLNCHANINANYFEEKNCLTMACSLGYFEMVKYFLTSPNLKNKPDIHAYKEKALIISISKGNYEISKFLIGESLEEKADIYTDNCFILIQACHDKQYNFVQYLLYEKEIIISKSVIENIAKILWHVPQEYQHILEMIEKRDLYIRLNKLSIKIKAETKSMKI